MESLQAMELEIAGEFPKFKIVYKDTSTFMKVIDLCLKLITFWQMQTFMHTFTTTIGYTVYVPTNWPVLQRYTKIGILRHERIHMRQKRKHFMFSFLYLFFPLPCLFAYYRMKFEMEAYEESMRYLVEIGKEGLLSDADYKKNMIRHFTSAQYFWTWVVKSKIEKWYDDTVSKLLKT